MVDVGHWLILLYEAVKNLPTLKLSQTGVVPQKEHRDRIIVEYTFSGVNQATTSLAPDSLKFGHALPRYLERLHRSDTRHGPVYMSKTDVADALMQIRLALHAIPTVAALLPAQPGESPLIAFPMVLPRLMSGNINEDPHHLSNVADTPPTSTSNQCLSTNTTNVYSRGPLLNHLSNVADTPPTSTSNQCLSTNTPNVYSRGPLLKLTNFTEVYMDDFLMASQFPSCQRAAIHNNLFHISIKKLEKGDAAWSTEKVVLGWHINTIQRTIELPQHRIKRLNDILNIPRHQHRTSLKRWQSLIGELCSTSSALPGSRGLFNQLQSVLNLTDHQRLILTQAVHDQLDDFW